MSHLTYCNTSQCGGSYILIMLWGDSTHPPATKDVHHTCKCWVISTRLGNNILGKHHVLWVFNINNCFKICVHDKCLTQYDSLANLSSVMTATHSEGAYVIQPAFIHHIKQKNKTKAHRRDTHSNVHKILIKTKPIIQAFTLSLGSKGICVSAHFSLI